MTLCKRLHIASSSRVTYAGHHDIYLDFCEAFGVKPLAPSEEELAMAAVHFAMGHTVRSVRPYMSAVQNLFNMHGAGPLPRGPGFVLTCRGLLRLLGPADVVDRTRALSTRELAAILRSLNKWVLADVSFGAECVVAFWLALRTEDHVAGRLRWGDVYMQEDGSVEFLLPPGKSVREFRHAAVARRKDILDVGLWLRRLARLVPAEHRKHASPVFVAGAVVRGRSLWWPTSRQVFTARLKQAVREVLGVDPAFYSGYSLRRGGATAMLGAAPEAAVKRHVGWVPNSNAPATYFDHRGEEAMRLATARVQ